MHSNCCIAKAGIKVLPGKNVPWRRLPALLKERKCRLIGWSSYMSCPGQGFVTRSMKVNDWENLDDGLRKGSIDIEPWTEGKNFVILR